MIEAFEGNKVETITFLPSLRALSRAGLRFIVCQKIPDVPYAVAQWMAEHPDHDPSDGLVAPTLGLQSGRPASEGDDLQSVQN